MKLQIIKIYLGGSSPLFPAKTTANGVTAAHPHGVGASGIIARNTEDDMLMFHTDNGAIIEILYNRVEVRFLFC